MADKQFFEDTNRNNVEERSYSVSEVAEILGASKRSIYNLCASGAFKSARIETKLRISRRSLDEWLDGPDWFGRESTTMASIQKRGKKYAVVYTCDDSKGEKKQKWETFTTKKEALERKAAVENEINNGTFIPLSELTVKDLPRDLVELYGTKRWGLSVYASNNGLISNYINPLIGDEIVQDINYRSVDQFIQKLQKTPLTETSYRHARTDLVMPCTIEKITKLMCCALHQAVRWDIIGKSPFEDATLPKRERKVGAIWTADIIRGALDHCSDGRLYAAINLAFVCSMWTSEITGLTWDCVHMSDEEIVRDDAFVWIKKELTRVDQKAISAVGEKDIPFVFPRLMGGKSSTQLVLKEPKTESSIRKVWIPQILAFILREWKEKQGELKELMDDDHIDYNLILTQETGRPREDWITGDQFEQLKKSVGLPNVVFYSLRRSSTTYKLKINKGDVEATQSDTGHAQSDMVTQVYTYILDEDRKANAQKLEMAFYANMDLCDVERRLRVESAAAEPDSEILPKQLEAKPELTDAFTKKFAEQYGEQIMNQSAKKLIGV